MLQPMTTTRLILRKPALSDAQDFFDMLSDAETCRADGGYPPYTAMDERVVRDLQSIVADSADRLFIEEKASGRMIGLLHVMPGSSPRQAEIGFVVSCGARRRGYACEAIRAMIRQLAASGDCDSVYATCYVFNEASAALLGKLGFQETGFLSNETSPEFSRRCFVLPLSRLPRGDDGL